MVSWLCLEVWGSDCYGDCEGVCGFRFCGSCLVIFIFGFVEVLGLV